MVDNNNRDAAKSALNRAKRRSVAGTNKKFIQKKSKNKEDFSDLKNAIEHLLQSQNWSAHTKIASLLEKWESLVGKETAQHVMIKNYDEEKKELVLSADSHTWAVQLRVLKDELEKKITNEIGPDFVTRVKVVGPAKNAQKHQWRAPSMNKFYDQF
jgi:predicted nucleic acid-binding Zn ribbon protein